MKAVTLILVAEDSQTNRAVLERQLKQLGLACELVENGQQALQAWQSGRFALLLSDCYMPVMDGFELTRAIRATEAGQAAGTRLPIIAITGNSFAEEAPRCEAAGMDACLSKPVEAADLAATLGRFLTLPDNATAIAAPAASEAPQPDNDVSNEVAGETGAIDPAVLRTITGDDEAMRLTFLHQFADSAAASAGEIRAAADAGALERVWQAAHKLKSAARSVGANALADCSQAIERAGKADSRSDIDAQLSCLDQELERALNYIDSA